MIKSVNHYPVSQLFDVGYRNGLKLNEDLASCQKWSIAQIEAHNKKLVDQAMIPFRMDGD